jgi:hypothetical protein
MNNNAIAANNRARLLGTLAARLTSAAYPIAARHGMKLFWVDLGIDLWTVLQHGVTDLGRKLARARRQGEFEIWRQCLLAELTEAAYRATVRYSMQRPSLVLEMDLYYAFCRVLDEIGRETLLCHILGVGSEAE